jgi:hypothetical protein
MRSFIGAVALGIHMLVGIPSTDAATLCDMGDSFSDPKLVLHDGKSSLFWVRPIAVNVDGAPNAYHRDDPHGNRGLAIEYIGYGMKIFKFKDEEGKEKEKIPFVTKESDNASWLAIYRQIVANNWVAPKGYSFSVFGFEKDDAGQVCHGGPKEDGKLVSSTALVIKSGADACDQSGYVDALRFPGIVIPKRDDEESKTDGTDGGIAPPFAKLGTRRGDLAVAYNPKTKRWRGAFVFDTGPRQKLGEGSVRLIMNLTGAAAPTTAEASNSMGIKESYVVLFPGSVADLGDRKNWTPELVEKMAMARFKAWGGGTIKGALSRLQSCAADYKDQM